MFKKVLKYDMAAIKRYWWLIAVTVLGMSVVGSLVFRGITVYANKIQETPEQSENALFALAMMAGIIFLIICVMAAFSSVFITPVMTHLRFYRNFFTDEGYLTFTLPVSRKTLYLSKTVNSMLWMVLHVLLLVAGCAIAFTLAPVPEKGQLFDFFIWDGIGSAVSEAWQAFGAWFILYVAEVIVLLLCSSAMTVGLVQLCITIGSVIAKKHKLLAAIGIYYAVNMALSTLSQTLLGCGSTFLFAGMAELGKRATESEQHASIALVLLIAILAVASIAMVMHFIALGLLERKLNLA